MGCGEGISSARRRVDASSAWSCSSDAEVVRVRVISSIVFIHDVMPLSCSAISSSLVLVSALCCSMDPITAVICAWTTVGALRVGARSTPGPGIPAEGLDLRWRNKPPPTAIGLTDRAGTEEHRRLLIPSVMPLLGFFPITDTGFDYKRKNGGRKCKGEKCSVLLLSPLFSTYLSPSSFIVSPHPAPCWARQALSRWRLCREALGRLPGPGHHIRFPTPCGVA